MKKNTTLGLWPLFGKQLILLFSFLVFGLLSVQAQTTYYWVGGAGTITSPGAWTTAGNWKTVLGGASGSTRATPASNDILIFDGSNIGSGATGTVYVGSLPTQTIYKLILQNSANVVFSTTSRTALNSTTLTTAATIGTFNSVAAGTSGTFGATITSGNIGDIVCNQFSTGAPVNVGQLLTTSTTSYTISGQGSSQVEYKANILSISQASGFTIDATSTLNLSSGNAFAIKLLNGASGTISGTINVTTAGQKIITQDATYTAASGALTFASGSALNITSTIYGNVFDYYANSTNDNVLFQSGSSYNLVAPVQATATASISGGIVTISFTNRGSGYVTLPTITVSGGTTSGTAATFTAVVGGVNGSTAIVGGLVNSSASTSGTGYTVAPTITISAPTPQAATGAGLPFPYNGNNSLSCVKFSSGSTFSMNGVSSYTSTTTMGNRTFPNFSLTNGSTFPASGNLTINGTLGIDATSTLTMGNNQLLSGTLSTISGTGTINTASTNAAPIPASQTWTQLINYNSSSAQTVVAGTYSNGLNLTGGARTLPSSLNISGTYTAGAGAITLSSGTVSFSGTSSIASASSFYNLVVGDGTNATPVTLGGAVTVNNNLTFTSGASAKITLGSNNLTLASVPTIASPSITRCIITNGTGGLTINSVPTSSTLFPISTGTSYAPLTFVNGTAGRNITASVGSTFTNSLQPGNKVVNLQWSILASGATSPDITFQYNGTDQASGYTSTGAVLGTYVGGGYTETALTSVSGSDPYTSTLSSLSLPTSVANLYGIGNPNSFQVPLGVPTGASAVGASPVSATVSFTAPSPATGITGYRVTASPGGFTASGTSSPITITGLSPVTTYTFSVQSTDGSNYSAGAVTNAITTPAYSYTWIGGANNDMSAANWNPSRTSPLTSDVLNFNGSNIDGANGTGNVSVTVTSQTIGQLNLLNSANVSLVASTGSGKKLTIAGASQTVLSIPSGSTLRLASGSAATDSVAIAFSGTSLTATIAGTLIIDSSSTTAYTANVNKYNNCYYATNCVTTVTGTIINGGLINSTASNLIFGTSSSNLGNYTFNRADGIGNISYPTADYTFANVTVQGISGTTIGQYNNVPISMNSFTLNCPSLTTGRYQINGIASGNTVTIAKDFTITMGAISSSNLTTGINVYYFGANAVVNYSIGGNLSITNAALQTSRAGWPNTFTVTGNMTLSNAALYMLTGSPTTGTNGASATLIGGIYSLTVNGNYSQSGSLSAVVLNGESTTNNTTNFTVKGNFSKTGGAFTFNSSTPVNSVAKLQLAGTAAQTFSIDVALTTNTNSTIEIANAGTTPNNTVTLNSSLTHSGILKLTSGLLVLGVNNITLSSGATISTPSSSSYIVTNSTGALIMNNVQTSSTVFPIGISTSYTPLTFANGTAGRNITASVSSSFTNSLQPGNHVVNLQWSILASGATSPDVTFQYNSANQAVGYTSTGAVLGTYVSGTGGYTETALTSVSGTNPYTTTLSLNLATSSASLYGIGNPGSFYAGLGLPTGVGAVASSATSATISFTPPSITAGITGYVVTSSPDNITANGLSSPITITGLTPGTSYTFNVESTDGTNYSTVVGSNSITTPSASYTWVGGATGDMSASNWNPSRTTARTTDILNFDGSSIDGSVGTGPIKVTVSTQTIGQLTLTNNANVSLVPTTGAGQKITIAGVSGTGLIIPSGSTLQLAPGSAATDSMAIAFSGTNLTATIAGTLIIDSSTTFATYGGNANTGNFSKNNNCYYAANSITTVTGTITNGGVIVSTASNLIFGTSSSSLGNYEFNRQDTTANINFPTANYTNANVTIKGVAGTRIPSFRLFPISMTSFTVNCPNLTSGRVQLSSLASGTSVTIAKDFNLTMNRTSGSLVNTQNSFYYAGSIVANFSIGGNLDITNAFLITARLGYPTSWAVTGNMNVNNGGFTMLTGTPTSGTLNSGTYSLTVNGDYTQTGSYNNVTLNSETTTNNTTNFVVLGNFSKSGGSFNLSTSSTNASSVAALKLTGSSTQTFSADSILGANAYSTIEIANNVNLVGNLAMPLGTLKLTSGTLTVGAGDTLQLPTTISRTSGIINASNATATVLLGAATTISASTFSPATIGNLAITSAAPTISTPLTVSNTLSLNATSSLNYTIANGSNLTVSSGATVSRSKTGTGQLSFGTTPTYTSLANTNFSYSGTKLDTIGTEMPTGANTINSLTINNTGGLTLSGNLTTNAALSLTAGKLFTLNNTVTPNSIVGGNASSYIVPSSGFLRLTATSGAAKLFPVGVAGGYAPLFITPSATQTYNVATSNTYTTQPGDTTQVLKVQWSVLGTSATTTASIKYGFGTTVFPTGYTVTASELGNDIGAGWNIVTSAKSIVPTTDSTNYYSLTATGLSIPISGVNNYVLGNTGNVVVTSTQWTGTKSTDWNNYLNWTNNVPSASDSAVITLVTAPSYSQPTISAAQSVKSINIASGVTIVNNGTLTIISKLINNGIISGTGTTILGGSSQQVISGNGLVGNLTLNNSNGDSVSNATGNSLGITGVLTLQTGTLKTYGRVTLKSTSIGNTSILAAIDGTINKGTIAGTVTVERYIPKGYRAYRDMAPEVYGAGTINANWQEGATTATPNPRPGYGIFITGGTAYAGAANAGTLDANGFDETGTVSGNTQDYTYVPSNTVPWTALNNTNPTSLDAFTGYRLLIRGDRSPNLYTSNVINTQAGLSMYNATTLRATGYLVYGNVSYTSSGVSGTAAATTADPSTPQSVTSANKLNTASNGFSMIANPYVSPVSWTAVYAASGGAASSHINGSYWYLDPTSAASGKYIAFNALSGSVTVNGSTGTYTNTGTVPVGTDFIQPGQAFFVQNATSGTPTVLFTEACKQASSTNLKSVFGTASLSKIYVSLLRQATGTTTYNAIDAAAVAFRSDFGNKAYGPQDAIKFSGANDNLFISDKGKDLSIDGRLPATASDAISLKISKPTATAYQLSIDASSYVNNGFEPLLYDVYRNTTKALGTGNTTISFTVDATKTASFEDRFTILFAPSALPVNSIVASASLSNKIATINWNTVGEKNVVAYEVEKSADAKNFTAIEKVTAKNTATASYASTDNSVTSTTYYRIKAISTGGSISYSNVAKLTYNVQLTTYNLYPNPLKGKTLNVELANVVAGKYTVSIYNTLGQKVNEQTISHTGGSATHAISINNVLAAGVYSITISEANSKQVVHQSNLSVQP